jgi:hypothetical protein
MHDSTQLAHQRRVRQVRLWPKKSHVEDRGPEGARLSCIEEVRRRLSGRQKAKNRKQTGIVNTRLEERDEAIHFLWEGGIYSRIICMYVGAWMSRLCRSSLVSRRLPRGRVVTLPIFVLYHNISIATSRKALWEKKTPNTSGNLYFALTAIPHSSVYKNEHKHTTALDITPSNFYCLATNRLHLAHKSNQDFRSA